MEHQGDQIHRLLFHNGFQLGEQHRQDAGGHHPRPDDQHLMSDAEPRQAS